MLQQFHNFFQAIGDETDIFREQTDALIEQDNDLIQTLDSPSSDDAADRKQHQGYCLQSYFLLQSSNALLIAELICTMN